MNEAIENLKYIESVVNLNILNLPYLDWIDPKKNSLAKHILYLKWYNFGRSSQKANEMVLNLPHEERKKTIAEAIKIIKDNYRKKQRKEVIYV